LISRLLNKVCSCEKLSTNYVQEAINNNNYGFGHRDNSDSAVGGAAALARTVGSRRHHPEDPQRRARCRWISGAQVERQPSSRCEELGRASGADRHAPALDRNWAWREPIIQVRQSRPDRHFDCRPTPGLGQRKEGLARRPPHSSELVSYRSLHADGLEDHDRSRLRDGQLGQFGLSGVPLQPSGQHDGGVAVLEKRAYLQTE
jgi:hypothetical protein